MSGILYGIGIGPGDPSMLTQKAIEVIKNCKTIALPSSNKENCIAYKILKKAIPQIELKDFLFLDFPMTKDKSILENFHKNAAEKIATVLQTEQNIAFISIGDITIYSTFIYIQKKIEEKKIQTKLINGIPSFCAVSAKLGISLSEKNEQIHIIPGSYDLSDSFSLEGTLIYMKAGNKLFELKNFLLKKQLTHNFDFYAISNCDLENEQLFHSINELPDNSSYWTIVLIKNKKEKQKTKHFNFFQNKNCELFPCHKTCNIENFNCLFCYCPLYFLEDKCGGNFYYTDKGIKSCINCNIPHIKDNYKLINEKLKKLNS